MTVGELIEVLSKYDKDMKVVDYMFDEIQDVKEDTCIDTNYPYDKPDKQVVRIM